MADKTLPPVSQIEFQPPSTIFDPSTCVRKGLCPVTQIRNQRGPFESHSLYFEVHGSGPEKVVVIMGICVGSTCGVSQVEHFARKPEYSVLVFDNRGVGHSGVPWGPYSTVGMAEDTITLLDFVGWNKPRQLHVMGISLGGMIAQELAFKIPERVVSLTLVVTQPGGRRYLELPSYAGMKGLLGLMVISDQEKKLRIIMDTIFPKEWLESKDDTDPEGRTNREVEAEAHRRMMNFNGSQSLLGAISQMIAALGHYVGPDRLQQISSSIPKVAIICGDSDNLVDTSNSHLLKKHMPDAELIVRECAGHGITIQYRSWFNGVLERIFKEGRERQSGRKQLDAPHAAITPCRTATLSRRRAAQCGSASVL
ncbi:alpha/beta-hydrolase [Lenzites betulinus]|nr:alpha/beta-hydrolase [Lenzites betulinus]